MNFSIKPIADGQMQIYPINPQTYEPTRKVNPLDQKLYVVGFGLKGNYISDGLKLVQSYSIAQIANQREAVSKQANANDDQVVDTKYVYAGNIGQVKLFY